MTNLLAAKVQGRLLSRMITLGNVARTLLALLFASASPPAHVYLFASYHHHHHHRRVRSFLFIGEGSESRKPSCRSVLLSPLQPSFKSVWHLCSPYDWLHVGVFFQLQRKSAFFWDHTDGKSMLLFVRCCVCVCDPPACSFVWKEWLPAKLRNTANWYITQIFGRVAHSSNALTE